MEGYQSRVAGPRPFWPLDIWVRKRRDPSGYTEGIRYQFSNREHGKGLILAVLPSLCAPGSPCRPPARASEQLSASRPRSTARGG